MMRYVVIVETAKDRPLWPGLPKEYPVICLEFKSLEEATTAYPGKTVMAIDDYKVFAKDLQDKYPAPETGNTVNGKSDPTTKKWWNLWGLFKR